MKILMYFFPIIFIIFLLIWRRSQEMECQQSQSNLGDMQQNFFQGIYDYFF